MESRKHEGTKIEIELDEYVELRLECEQSIYRMYNYSNEISKLNNELDELRKKYEDLKESYTELETRHNLLGAIGIDESGANK